MRLVAVGLVQYTPDVAQGADCTQLHLDTLLSPGVGKQRARHTVAWDQIYRPTAQERRERDHRAATGQNQEKVNTREATYHKGLGKLFTRNKRM